MEYRTLGASEVKVSAIAFGAWAIGGWMWGGQDESDAIAAIHAALDGGVRSIDTAAIYGFGASEELVGRALDGVPRDSVQILTKYGLRWDTTEGEGHWESRDNQGNKRTVVRNARKDSVIHECEQSLRRLRTDYVDVYQCHWRDTATPLGETMEAMDRLLAQGKIRAAGVSNFSAEEIAACAACGPLASAQPPYSMVNRGIEADILPYCRENHIGVLAYSPLQRGLLTGKITMDYEFKEGDHRPNRPLFQPESRRRILALLEKLRPLASAHGATLAQLAISWTIHRPGITAALVGARNPRQARENAAAAELQLAEDETRHVNALLDDLRLE